MRWAPAVAFLVLLVAFLPTLTSFHRLWSAAPNTHGYPIAIGTVWLVWRERSVLWGGRSWTLPLVLILVPSLVWLIARTANVQVVAQAALPLVALLWAAAVFGPRALRRLAPAALLFLIAVPLWSGITPLLRRLTIAVTYGLLGLLNIPVTIDGTVIHVAHGSFLIEDACAGFNYFMAAFAIGGLYAAALVESLRARIAILLLALSLSVVGNWIRVTSLVVIGHVSRMEAAILYDHRAYGWIVFLVFVLLVFFPIAGLVSRRERRMAPPDQRPAPIEAPSGRRLEARATALAVIGPVIYLACGSLPTRRPQEPSLAAGMSPWVVTDLPRPYDWRPSFRGFDGEIHTVWSDTDTEVAVDLLEYQGQEQDAELIGYANRIAPDSVLFTHRMSGPVGPTRRYLNEAIVRDGEGFVLVWYWYRVGGIETASPLKAKLLEVPAFFRRIQLSELVAVSTACEPDSCEAAAGSLRSFLGET